MTTRHSSSIILCALAFAFAVAPAFFARAQAPAATPADASSSNAAPAAPPEPAATPAPAAPADTNAAPAPAPAPTPEERPSTYTIVQGDSLWKIAHKFGTTVVKLRKLNNLKKGALLHPGQVLQLPPATSDTTTQ
jgi:LysM repeat protein